MYGSRTVAHRITVLPGDGIGPEVTTAARRVLDASSAPLEWEVAELRAGRPSSAPMLSEEAVASIGRNRVALKGPTATPLAGSSRSLNLELRRRLDLYAQVRPARTLAGAPGPFGEVDLVVIRETTEDLYAGVELARGTDAAGRLIELLAAEGLPAIRPDSGLSIKPQSEAAARRIVRFAFDYARSHGRRRVTAVHKATVMRSTDGLFLEIAREVAAEQPDVELDDLAVDTLALTLVRRPQSLDVLVMGNLYGDIVSDLAAGLVGGLGVAPGANFGPEAAVFEPVHGSAPRHAGRDTANPLAMILSGVLLLRHLGEAEAAARVEQAVAAVLAAGEAVPADLLLYREGTPAGTRRVADAVVRRLERL